MPGFISSRTPLPRGRGSETPPGWPVLMACVAALAFAMAGCAAHAEYRVYDPYYSDYHVWGPDEAVYYNRWIAVNHRPYVEYRKLNREDQRTYWTWRHAQK